MQRRVDDKNHTVNALQTSSLNGSFNISVSFAMDLALAIMISGFIGARAFHIFYENFSYYQQTPIDVFKIWQGGFVYYGGLLAALASTVVYLRLKKQSFARWADLLAPILSLGYALGRIGCFLNGCCYGAECPLPGCTIWGHAWSVEFIYPGLPEGLLHPTQLYAVFWELTVVAVLLLIERKILQAQKTLQAKSAVVENSVASGTSLATRIAWPGFLFTLWIFLHSIGRLIMEVFRVDFRGELIFGLSISLWLSLLLLMSTLAIIAKKSLWPRPTFEPL